MTGTAASDDRHDLVDATQYDLDRLERAVRDLVAQQQAMTRENAELREALARRDAEVSRLATDLGSVEKRRQAAIGKIEALIDELDRLDATLDSSMADSKDRVVDPDLQGSPSGDVAG